MTVEKTEHSIQLRWRMLSGLLAGLTLAAGLLALSSRPMLAWHYSSLAHDDSGLLHDGPAFWKFTVPQLQSRIFLLVCTLPFVGMTIQCKPWIPLLATKQSCAVLILVLLIAGSFLYREMAYYWHELLWMHQT